MPLPITFATLPAGDNPAALLDDQFTAIAGFTVIPCVATGLNLIQLEAYEDAPSVTTLSDLSPLYTFIAQQTCTGNVEINLSSLGQFPAYKNNGATLIVAGDIIQGCVYQAAFVSTFNGGGGGWCVNVFSAGLPTPPIPPLPPPITGGTEMPSQLFFITGSVTYTPSAGMVSVLVECVGGGGGGGAAFGIAGAGNNSAGGGGGSGGYSRGLFSAAEVGASQPVTIGAGGAAGATGAGGPGGITSFGGLLTANGGGGGAGYDGSGSFGAGGAGATQGTVPSGRGIILPGSGGMAGLTAVPILHGGQGGSMWGGEGLMQGAGPNTQTAGSPGLAGAGGSGGANTSNNSAWTAGGAGGQGWCCVTEYT
jgi:hypothetical protein